MECVRLRVREVEFTYHQIVVRDGKGQKDRVTMLPQALVEPLKRQLEKAKVLHEQDPAKFICPLHSIGNIRGESGVGLAMRLSRP